MAPLADIDLRKIEWLVLGGFILFVILDYAVAKVVKMLANHFLEMNGKNENLTNREKENYNMD